MSWKIVKETAQLILLDNLEEIKKILDPCSLQQRKCIMAFKIHFSSLLFIAVKNRRTSTVNYFLKTCEADPNGTGYIDDEELTCLSAATRQGSTIVARILLRYDADSEAVTLGQQTPLFYACKYKRHKIAKILIEHGANMDCHTNLGDSILVRSMSDLKLFKYLITMGANVNFISTNGDTPLMLALSTLSSEIISFLLSCENINIRLKNCFGEDALHVALRSFFPRIVEQIIKQGNYTINEIIKVCQVESCVLYTMNMRDKAKDLWETALRLQSPVSDPLIFRNPRLPGKLQEIADCFNSDDVPTLLYLESMNGLNNIFTLTAYISAAKNVTDICKYVRLSEYFLNILKLFDDYHFLSAYKTVTLYIPKYFIRSFSSNKSEILKLYELFVVYVEEVRFRLKRMSPQDIICHAHKVETHLYVVMDLLIEISNHCSNGIHSFQEGTKRILKADLRNLQQEALLHISIRPYSCLFVFNYLLSCGADVNSTSNEGKTVLHEVVESPTEIDINVIEKIIDKGFKFSKIKYNKYCLPCRMQRRQILPNPIKHILLQCLAARVFCEKTLTSFSDIPHHLKTIVMSHLYIL